MISISAESHTSKLAACILSSPSGSWLLGCQTSQVCQTPREHWDCHFHFPSAFSSPIVYTRRYNPLRRLTLSSWVLRRALAFGKDTFGLRPTFFWPLAKAFRYGWEIHQQCIRNSKTSKRYLEVCVCVCMFTFEVPFKRLFAPTFRSRMSKSFRDSESLGKSNGKKWSQIWTFLFGSGLKLPRKIA